MTEQKEQTATKMTREEEIRKEIDARVEQMFLHQVLEEHINQKAPHSTCLGCVRLGINKGYIFGIQETEARIFKKLLNVILKVRNDELWLHKTYRSLELERVLLDLGFDINTLPCGVLTEEQIEEYVGKELTKKIKDKKE